MREDFSWGSALGISVMLFIAIGGLWVVIGALTVPFHKTSGSSIVFVSTRSDTAYFGQPPQELPAAGTPWRSCVPCC